MDRKTPLPLPRALVVVIRPFQVFLRTSSASGIVLLLATIVAMVWANSRFAGVHEAIFGSPLAVQIGNVQLHWPVHHWINDGAMAVFFFLVGMEIKRELVVGELRTFGRAILPAIAALGGMIVPAAIYYALNREGPGKPGWGIPMATDIAFALGCISVVRGRVAPSLAVFLTALAIFDDLGAILVIALFYGHSVSVTYLAVAGAITLLLVLLNLFGVRSPYPYFLVGIALWYVVLRSGIHATVAGVVAGLCIPARAGKHPKDVLDDLDKEVDHLRTALAGEEDDDDEGNAALRAIERHLEDVQPPLNRLTNGLHAPVSFGIVPLFALANAGIVFRGITVADLTSGVSVGVMLGLFFGKPLGVFLFTGLGVGLRISPKPAGATWREIFGISVLAGIGFTMSLFISGLAFARGPQLNELAKIGILIASTSSAAVGLLFLMSGPRRDAAKQ
jgi:NhaA family Na+:H+ antiporter